MDRVVDQADRAVLPAVLAGKAARVEGRAGRDLVRVVRAEEAEDLVVPVVIRMREVRAAVPADSAAQVVVVWAAAGQTDLAVRRRWIRRRRMCN